MTQKLLNIIDINHISLVETNLTPYRLKGLYFDNVILLHNHLNSAEQNSILAEEIGHYITTTKNILDQSSIENEKQEEKARRYASDLLINPSDFVNAFNAGVRNRFELANYLDVTEDFIDYTISYFLKKFGQFVKLDGYTVFFEPLGVFKEL